MRAVSLLIVLFLITPVFAAPASQPQENPEAQSNGGKPPATPTGFKTMLVAGNAQLDWDPVPGAQGYSIYTFGEDVGAIEYVDSVNAPATTYTTSGLSPGCPRFYVVSYNGVGESAPSRIRRQAIPAPITGLRVGLSDDAKSATVQWNPDPNATGYLVSRGPDDHHEPDRVIATIWGGAQSAFVAKSLDPTLAYTFRLTPFYLDNEAVGHAGMQVTIDWCRLQFLRIKACVDNEWNTVWKSRPHREH